MYVLIIGVGLLLLLIWSATIINGIRILYLRFRRAIAMMKLEHKYRRYDFYIRERHRERLHYEEEIKKYSKK